MTKKLTFDIHTHIGQFNDIYYDYPDVFCALRNNGITETVLAYLTPSFNDASTSADFYHAVVQELKEAQEFARQIGLKTHILHWADPLLFDAGIMLQDIFSEFNYAGIALHPVLHNWTGVHKDKLTQIFRFAQDRKVPLYIHTGVSDCDEPMQFCRWFSDFADVEVHLAHCRDSSKIIKIFSTYKNVYGDTAFCPLDEYEKICSAGFNDRMFFGTDFPITHYWEVCDTQNKTVSSEILENHYRKLLTECVTARI